VYRDGGDAYTAFADVGKIVLAIELADSSLRKDRTLKRDRYALHGVPEYWIVNLRATEVEVYRSPRNGEYTQKRVYAPEEPVAPSALLGEPVRPIDIVLQ
jgi:Uma2 family endonuclease